MHWLKVGFHSISYTLSGIVRESLKVISSYIIMNYNVIFHLNKLIQTSRAKVDIWALLVYEHRKN